MKSAHLSRLSALCLLLSAGLVSEAMAQARPTTIPVQHRTASDPLATVKLPDHFTAYASASVGQDRRCVIGISTDEDGMKQTPVVYATNTSGKRLLWIARPELPADVYQSRATHCTVNGDALYVLLQSDTQASQSISQTLLRVVKLDASLGTVQLQKDVEIPGSYSAWVDKGATRFVWKRNRLVINGNSRLASDHERLQNFTVRLNSDLEPKGRKP